MSASKKHDRTLDQKFNSVVSLAEFIIDTPEKELQASALASIKPLMEGLIVELEQFGKSQQDCPDYVLVQHCSPKFLTDRLRLFAKCYERSRGVKSKNLSSRRRLVFKADDDDEVASVLIPMMARLEDVVWNIKRVLSSPSDQAMQKFYGRMDMAANINEHIHDSVVEDMNDYMIRLRSKGRIMSKLASKRQEVVQGLSRSGIEELKDVFEVSYDTVADFQIAVACCYYAIAREGKEVSIEEFMEAVYRFEACMDWGGSPTAEAAKMQPKVLTEGLEEVLAYVDSKQQIMEQGYTTNHFRQIFEGCMRDAQCKEYLLSKSGTCYKELNLTAFEKIVGLMMCHGLLNGGPSQLGGVLFGEESPFSGLQTANTVRVNISSGQQFDKPNQEGLKSIIETAIKMVKKSKAESV